MNVKQLIDKLRTLDPSAQVFVYTDEMGAPLRFIRTDGNELYFKSDAAHRDGMSHVYLCDYTGSE